MKRSNRYEEATNNNIKVPHIEFNGESWGVWTHIYQVKIRTEKEINNHVKALEFCDNLNGKLK